MGDVAHLTSRVTALEMELRNVFAAIKQSEVLGTELAARMEANIVAFIDKRIDRDEANRLNRALLCVDGVDGVPADLRHLLKGCDAPAAPAAPKAEKPAYVKPQWQIDRLAAMEAAKAAAMSGKGSVVAKFA
jgi:hypothetical protein